MAKYFEKLNFKNSKNVLVDNCFYVPVPKGYHFSENKNVIGDTRRLVIVPDNYKLSDDPMSASLGFSILELKVPIGRRFMPVFADTLVDHFASITSIFNSDVNTTTVCCRDGFTAAFQCYADDSDPNWIKFQGAFFADETTYFFHLLSNYNKNILNDKLVEEFFGLVIDWFERIRLVDEDPATFLKTTTAESELYPHYDRLRSSGTEFSGLSNVTVVVNATGTEFSCLPIDDFTNDSLARKINALDKAVYTLADEANKMAPLFRVNKSVFNPKEDRENDIMVCNMRRAYQQHALRSFAWTAADYCEENGIDLSELSEDKIINICNHIENVGWLNYKKNSHFPELCGNSDLHVFYVPDKTTKTDKKALIPESDDIFGGLFGAKTIEASVGSLDKLRKELEDIYPAIVTAYNMLAKDRNRNKPLTGAVADVVYAWCVLAKGAKTPFFTEDGPANGYYSWLGEGNTFPEYVAPVGSKKGTAKSTSKKESASPVVAKTSSTSAKYFDKFVQADVPASRKKLLTKLDHRRQEENPLGCDLMFVDLYDYLENNYTDENIQPTRVINSRFSQTKQEYYAKLLSKAVEYSKVFRTNDEMFNPKSDREAEIFEGYIKHVHTLHVYKSFLYAMVTYCKKTKKDISVLSLEEIIAAADFIEQCGGCSFKILTNASDEEFNTFRSQHEVNFGFDGAVNFIDFEHKKIDRGYGSTTGDVHSDLLKLEPVIDKIYDYLAADRNGAEPLTGILADVLFMWCAVTVASRRPFAVVEGISDYDIERNDGYNIAEEKDYSADIQKDENGVVYCGNVIIEKEGDHTELIVPEGITKIMDSYKLFKPSETTYAKTIKLPPHSFKKITMPRSMKTVCKSITGWWLLNSFETLVFTADNLEILDDSIRFGSEKRKVNVILPESTKTLGKESLYTSCGPVSVTLPQSITSIGMRFADKGEFTVYKDSYAERRLKELGYEYTVIYTEEQKEAMRRAEEERKAREKARLEELERQRKAEEERRRREAEERRIAEEKRIEEEKRIAAQRKAEYEALVAEKEQLLQTIAENKGLFGEKARRRKEAKAKLAQVEEKLANYPEFN